MWSLFLVYAFIMSNYSTLGDVHMLLGTERPLTIEWAFQLKYAGLFFFLLYFINSIRVKAYFWNFSYLLFLIPYQVLGPVMTP